MIKGKGGEAVFGLVTANLTELTAEEKQRYTSVYCGICRQIRCRASNLCRLGLQYDMAFLALLLMSLYEPEETGGKRACMLHPFRPRPWADCEVIGYAADMNVALACYKARDDRQDDGSLRAKCLEGIFGPYMPGIEERYPRQCEAIRECVTRLEELEKENCTNPDAPANCFGRLMGELLVYREDLWAPKLRAMGMALGRFIYLADAALDLRQDLRRGSYNPWLAMGGEVSPEDYLVLAMGACTEEYEKLPLVQDKKLLDNILYSGVWCVLRARQRKEGKA